MGGSLTESGTNRSQLLLHDLLELREQVVSEGDELIAQWRPALQRRSFVPSAVNLARYIALRRRDLRGLQEGLMPLGLSSLGRCEARVLENLDAVIASLATIAGEDVLSPAIHHPRPSAFYRGNRFLGRHTEAVFGPTPAGRQVRIMVTLPREAASDYPIRARSRRARSRRRPRQLRSRRARGLGRDGRARKTRRHRDRPELPRVDGPQGPVPAPRKFGRSAEVRVTSVTTSDS